MSQTTKVVLICGGLALAAAIISSAQLGYDVPDTFDCILTTGQHATRYATGYSDQAFSQIRRGMTPEEVQRILGEPLEQSTWSTWPEGDWQYSQPASSSGHYHFRKVRFAPDRRVSDTYRLFYFD